MAFQTSTGLGAPGGHITPPYYSDFLRENLYPSLHFRQLGTQVTIPRGYGDKVKIPRWASPITNSSGGAQLSSGGAVTAIRENFAEGSASDLGVLCAEDITGQVKRFVGGRGYTDQMIIVTKANYLEGALESLGRELAYRFDRFTRKNITASATLRKAGSGNATTTDQLFGKAIAKLRPYMDAANAPAWDDESFVAVVTPLAQYDIFRDPSATGFVPIVRYNDATRAYRGEIGQMYGIRFLLSNSLPLFNMGPTNLKVTNTDGATSATDGMSSKATGSNAYVFAPDAFYSIELEGGGIEVIHHPPGSSGSVSDFANQKGSIAVKAWYGVTAAPSSDNRLIRFAHGIGLGF